MPILFCNVGWMDRYQGLHSGDHITGGGFYVREKGRGHEICNFAPHKGILYGYVQPPGQGIDITRLGANPADESISGITVVWTAVRPTGGTVVVGWYKDATVFRTFQEFETAPPIQEKNKVDGYYIRARRRQAKLLSVDARTCEIPRGKGGLGQANIWYADKRGSSRVVKRVSRLVAAGKPIGAGGGHKSYHAKQDQKKKVQIEQAALATCSNYFETLGYQVKTVMKDNLGWDLEAKSGKSTLRIEVKGLSGSTFAVELTPNEYNAFKANAADYRLAVVLKALGKKSLQLCRYSDEKGTWVIDSAPGKAINVQERVGAAIKGV